ncbi:hypothetical protein [Polaribacter sp. Hel1_85]|uniref:hypothetical protein n=1 Tax=Polaribacter sp. Hel1_85 TaxID=1250005 RepID=UPI00052BC586|nr:hypothetical protein [Polaribacter sp. Hel1_85]KGL64037.1 hypothetical protein PHEL85_1079 [Polaribacter sp. Hel1_85]
MHRFITLFLLIFFLNSYAQEKVTLDKAIGNSCFFSGRPTPIVKEFFNLIDSLSYRKIKKELFSKNPENKLLSLLILVELERLETFKLTQKQKEQIQIIKNSNEKVLVCSGCTFLKEIPLKDYFKSYNQTLFLSIKSRLAKS